jgi:hypothetical protein
MPHALWAIQLTVLQPGSESIWILNLPRKFAGHEGGGERFVGNVGDLPRRARRYTKKRLERLIWLLVIYIALFAFSQGAVIWVYISEVFPNRVRAKGQSLGSFTHWICAALISLGFPRVAQW